MIDAANARTKLVEVEDADFAWMIQGQPPVRDGLSLPATGVEPIEILEYLRALVRRLQAAGSRSVWMVIADDTVVGLCGFKSAPDASGAVEIGYGLNAEYRGRGHATRAIGLLVLAACEDPTVRVLTAEIAIANIASHRVVEANGFVRTGSRIDDDDGELVIWQRSVQS